MISSRKTICGGSAALAVLTAALFCPATAAAQGIVYYGPPSYTYYAPAPVYYAPAPVYVASPPAVVYQAPVVVEPAPTVVYQQPVVFEPAPVVTYYGPASIHYRPLSSTRWKYEVRTPYGEHEYRYKYDRRTGLVRVRYDFND